MLVTDDDSAGREQGVGSGGPRDAEHEDELSTAPSADRSIEEFGLLQRHVATVIQQLGHAGSLHTTTVYLRHIAPVELVETMRRQSRNP